MPARWVLFDRIGHRRGLRREARWSATWRGAGMALVLGALSCLSAGAGEPDLPKPPGPRKGAADAPPPPDDSEPKTAAKKVTAPATDEAPVATPAPVANKVDTSGAGVEAAILGDLQVVARMAKQSFAAQEPVAAVVLMTNASKKPMRLIHDPSLADWVFEIENTQTKRRYRAFRTQAAAAKKPAGPKVIVIPPGETKVLRVDFDATWRFQLVSKADSKSKMKLPPLNELPAGPYQMTIQIAFPPPPDGNVAGFSILEGWTVPVLFTRM